MGRPAIEIPKVAHWFDIQRDRFCLDVPYLVFDFMQPAPQHFGIQLLETTTDPMRKIDDVVLR